MHTNTHIHAYTYTHTCIHILSHTHIHFRIHIHTHTCIHIHICIHTCIRIHTYMHTHTHIHTHMHTHTHKNISHRNSAVDVYLTAPMSSGCGSALCAGPARYLSCWYEAQLPTSSPLQSPVSQLHYFYICSSMYLLACIHLCVLHALKQKS